MACPRLCPANLYKIMATCWNVGPAERPSFDELVTEVRGALEQQLKEGANAACKWA